MISIGLPQPGKFAINESWGADRIELYLHKQHFNPVGPSVLLEFEISRRLPSALVQDGPRTPTQITSPSVSSGSRVEGREPDAVAWSRSR